MDRSASLHRVRGIHQEIHKHNLEEFGVSERARRLIHYLLWPELEVSQSRKLRMRVATAAVISTIPRWMRQLAGIDQGPIVDAAVAPLTRLAIRRLACASYALASASNARAFTSLHLVAKPLREPPQRRRLHTYFVYETIISYAR